MGIAIPMLDLMFFLTETRDNPRHVGATLLFERPRRGGDRIVDAILDAYRNAEPVPPFNRVPQFLGAGLPEWREVSGFDRDWHVRRLTLPAPGSDAQLHEVVAALHEPMLDRSRPGWQVHVIDGLQRDRFAIFIKVHHSLVDGESGIELVHRSLSRSSRDRRLRTVVETTLPVRKPAVSRERLHGLARDVQGAAGTAVSIGLGARRLLGETLSGLVGPAVGANGPFAAPWTPMNEPIHRARAVTHTILPLGEMKTVARAWDATLNDVALCVLDAAMNRYLARLGRRPERPLVATCPVSLQDARIKQAATLVSILWTPLGKPDASIGRRMRAVIANVRAAKVRIRTLPKEAAYAYAVLSFALGETLALVRPAGADLLLPSNVMISNVRGPGRPLYLGGARLEALCPVSTLIAGMGLNITLMSYDGKVVIGFTANASALPGVDRLASYSEEAFGALRRHTARWPPAAPRARHATGRS